MGGQIHQHNHLNIMIETNELTRTLKTLLIPKAALIAYASENEKNFFLEVRDIDERGNMTEGRPVTLEFMNELVKGFRKCSMSVVAKPSTGSTGLSGI